MRGATTVDGILFDSKTISIHAPHAGSDAAEPTKDELNKFQSTLPMRGATSGKGRKGSHGQDFNPRSPCGERRVSELFRMPEQNFNPRSPCGERQVRIANV